MKKRHILLFCFLIMTHNAVYTAQNYHIGNTILGIGLGVSTPHINPTVGPQLAIHPSLEFIVGSWTKVALGIVIDSSLNVLGGFGSIGTLAPMISVHTTLVSKLDWYVSLGMGLQLFPAETMIGIYTVLAGFATGFNVMITPRLFWNIGLAIHSRQFLGTTGIRYRFGKTN